MNGTQYIATRHSYTVKCGCQNANTKAAQAASCEAQTDTMLQMDIEYIKRAVDDIRIDQRAQRDVLGTYDQYITRVEESAKQAHKRIDEIAGNRREGI